jgi:hypothetical protein
MIGKAIAIASLLSIAPIQCAHSPDPNERREDSPGDALWTMSQKFASEQNTTAEKETLEYLISQYPSSRHFGAAREELQRLGGAAPAAVNAGDAGNSG